MKACVGFEIVCPDGHVRFYPFHHFDDAECEARHASGPLPRKRAPFCEHWRIQVADRMAGREETPCFCVARAGTYRPGCSGWPEPSDLELRYPPCPGGEHTVRAIPFNHSEHASRGQA